MIVSLCPGIVLKIYRKDSSNAQKFTAWRRKQAYGTQTMRLPSRHRAMQVFSFQSEVCQKGEGRRINFLPLYKVQLTLAIKGPFVNSYMKEKPHKATLYRVSNNSNLPKRLSLTTVLPANGDTLQILSF